MARINFSSIGKTPFQKLLGYNNEILQSWANLEDTLFKSETLTSSLKEYVRKSLAFENQCQY